ncbi:MAG: hypothetical protein IJY08_00390 [Clostridia bacterium]|nr:hypothetical protein [Clostridia bacterium]
MKQSCNINLRVSEDLLRKFLFIAEKEKLSPSSKFSAMVRNNVQYYEKTKGRISDADLKRIDISEYTSEE